MLLLGDSFQINSNNIGSTDNVFYEWWRNVGLKQFQPRNYVVNSMNITNIDTVLEICNLNQNRKENV